MVVEEIEGVNAYRWHVEELQKRFGPPGSAWEQPKQVGQPASVQLARLR